MQGIQLRVALGAAALLGAPLAAEAQFVEPVTVLHTFDGAAAGDGMGVVRNLGDLDGDGRPDIGIGVARNNDNGANAGKVYIFSGASGDTIRTHVRASGSHFGYDLSTIGDVNGDGVPEYAVTAPRTVTFTAFNSGFARVYVFDGASGTSIANLRGLDYGIASGGGFGAVVSGLGNAVDGGAGDADGDGIPDYFIGANLASGFVGQVLILSGADLVTVIHSVTGEAVADLFGFGGGGTGDLDGDGRADFIVGAPDGGPGDRGRAYVYSGATGLQFPFSPIDPDTTGGRFAFFFANSPGDLDGDGRPDLVIGDFQDGTLGTNTGKIYTYSGVDGSLLYTVTGDSAGAGFGVVRGAGDADFDGTPDLFVASFTSSAGGTAAGKCEVLSGADGTVLRTLTGTLPNDFFGISVFPAGDTNGDGAQDFLASSTGHDTAGDGAGRVYVIAGVAAATDAGAGALGLSSVLPGLRLGRPHPSPTLGETQVAYERPAGGDLTAAVHDVTGRTIRQLHRGPAPESGVVRWDGRDAAGQAVAAGVYWIRIATPDGVGTRRVVRLR